VSFEHFCVVIFDLSIEDFFLRFNMASDLQDGGRNSKEHNLVILQYFCVLFFAISFLFFSNMNLYLFICQRTYVLLTMAVLILKIKEFQNVQSNQSVSHSRGLKEKRSQKKLIRTIHKPKPTLQRSYL
jgi:hypothetical protein